MQSIFSSEAEMQTWIKAQIEEKDGLADVIHNLDQIENIEPSDANAAVLLASYKRCVASLRINELVSANEDISADKSDVLRPDFILYAAETESIVIVEIKNISGPTRQAGTELAAYGCEIRSYVPFIADGDLVNVIVSVDWPALLKHYVRHEIFWQKRNVICLRPVKRLGEIQLEVLPPEELAEGESELKVPPQYLGGYQICLYDYELYSSNPDRSRLDKYVEQFRTALRAMASTGAQINSHGFAFLWNDLWSKTLAPYVITTFNFAPFQTVERFLHIEGAPTPRMFDRFCRLVRDFGPLGHGSALSRIAHSADPFLGNVCKPMYEGFTTWEAHRAELVAHNAQLIAFVAWGKFEELFFHRLAKEYESGNLQIDAMDPTIGLAVVDSIVDSEYSFIDVAHCGTFDEEEADST